MAANTKIEWARHTFNPWYGCTHVSEACRFCYAEELMATRFKRVKWGAHGDRVLSSEANWKEPYLWNRAAADAGERHSVFCLSLGDNMDEHPSIKPEWRNRLWKTIAETQSLEWLLLTKRPKNWPFYLPVAEPRPPFLNIRLGVTIEDQAALTEHGPPLSFAHAIGWPTFVSYEPALGRLDLHEYRSVIDWLIAGGESGVHARCPDPEWFRFARAQAAKYGIPFLFKQWGQWAPAPNKMTFSEAEKFAKGRKLHHFSSGETMIRFQKKEDAGRKLDGVEYSEFPRALDDAA